MNRVVRDGLRAGTAAVSVAAGLMALACSSQTTDGFVQASFGGPMDVFGGRAADVLAMGDGAASDAAELAALLRGPNGPTAEVPDSPYRAAFEAGATPSPTAPPVLPQSMVGPTAAPAVKDAAILPVRQVVDAQGRVDCTGSVSCKTDPATNTTTVTFPDGIVAIVQQVNDLTVVAYKTLAESLPWGIKDLLLAPPTQSPALIAAAPSAPMPAPSALPSEPPSASPSPMPTEAKTEMEAPAFDPGPLAPENDVLKSSDSGTGPKINVTRPPMDFSPDSTTGGLPGPTGSKPKFPVLDKVKDALGSAANAVTDAVGKAINPGAASQPPDRSDTGGE